MKMLSVLMLVLILFGSLSFVMDIQPVKSDYVWTETIHIRADGSIDPPDAPISTLDIVTYTLTGNISSVGDGIVVERNNIVIDGAGYTVRGSGIGNGTSLVDRSNVTARNMTTIDFDCGIYLRFSSNCVLSGNNVANSYYGIRLFCSSGNTLSGNTATLNGYGIELYYSSGNTLSSNNVTKNNVGILLHSSSGNTLSSNNVTSSTYTNGIKLFYSSGNTLSSNNVTSNYGNGVGFFDSSNNTLSGNNVKNNDDGFELFASSNNTFAGNNVTANYGTGVWLYSCSGNLFYHNSFIANTQQVNSTSSGTSPTNVWDDGYPSGGNYWSDYYGEDLHSSLNQTVTGSDGIGDTPYIIDANDIDHYPLVGMFQSYDVTYYTLPLVAHSCNVTVISNSTVSNFASLVWIEHPEVIMIEFNVTEEQGTTGFCRVSFPTAMMNGTYHVFVNGTEVPCILLPCSNADYSHLYFTYSHSTEGVIIIPELPSFLIPPLFMLLTMLSVVSMQRRIQRKQKMAGDVT